MSALNVFKVFIGNLPSNLTEGEIRNLLRETQVDDGSILEIMLRRQHAIVSFNEQIVADAVIDNLHSKMMMGRILKVERATETDKLFELELARCELLNKLKSLLMLYNSRLHPTSNYLKSKEKKKPDGDGDVDVDNNGVSEPSVVAEEPPFNLDKKEVAEIISAFEKKLFIKSSQKLNEYLVNAQEILEKFQLSPQALSFIFLSKKMELDYLTMTVKELKDKLPSILTIYGNEKNKSNFVLFPHLNGDEKKYSGDRKYIDGFCLCLTWKSDLVDHLRLRKCPTKFFTLCPEILEENESSTKSCQLCDVCECSSQRGCIEKYVLRLKLRHGNSYRMINAPNSADNISTSSTTVKKAGEIGAGPSSAAGENPEEPSSSVGEKSESPDGGESGTEPSVTGDNENPEEPSSTVDEESENPLGDGDGERDAGLGDDENPENGKTPSDIGGPSSEEPSGPSEPQYDITLLEDYTADGDHRVGKHIPEWAKKENLDKALVYQIPRGNTDLSTLVFSKDHRSLRDLFPEKYATTTPATVDSNNSTTTDSDTSDDSDVDNDINDSNKEAEGGGNKSVQSGHPDDKNGNEADEVGGGYEAGKKGSKSLRKRSFSIGARLVKSRGQKPSNN